VLSAMKVYPPDITLNSTMVEIYEAYTDYNNMMKLVEDMMCYIATEVAGKAEIKFGKELIKLTPPCNEYTCVTQSKKAVASTSRAIQMLTRCGLR